MFRKKTVECRFGSINTQRAHMLQYNEVVRQYIDYIVLKVTYKSMTSKGQLVYIYSIEI